MHEQLTIPTDTFRLVQIGKHDAANRSDYFLDLRAYVLRSEDRYPGIAKWFDSKVIQGFRSGQRVGYVGLVNEQPVGASILKRGEKAKFCHVNIDTAARSRSLGDLFFLLMTLDIKGMTQKVRFTLPESVWEDRKLFFNSHSFVQAEKSHRQYRMFDTELHSETSYDALYASTRSKLPKIFGNLALGDHSLLTGAVMALHAEPLAKIFSGEKTVEIRARFSTQWEGRRITLYRTAPLGGIAGEAKVTRVLKGTPDRIWELVGHVAGCSRSEYESHVGSRSAVFAVFLTDVVQYRDAIPLIQLSHLLGVHLPAPQSYLSLANNDDWLTAVVLAAALQGGFKVSRLRTALDRSASTRDSNQLRMESSRAVP